MSDTEKYSVYYQAQATKSTLWFVMGAVRNEDNLALARTLDTATQTLEFFVAPAFTEHFESLLGYLLESGHLKWFERKPNRLVGNATVD